VNSRRDAVAATLLYAAVTIVWTWPLARGLARDVPADFGDPLLNCWILAWDVTHLGRGWWNANIFYPHPLALAYSEHLLPQALQIAPLYAITKNPILSYNVVFLSTFVLSGLGMFLLARECLATAWHRETVPGCSQAPSRAAAVVAGLAYAFAPYRVGSLPHLQVLSSAWMPFALFGFRRYFETGRRRALVGAAAAWTLQNLSCGYYLLFFTPIVVLYLAWEIVTRRQTIDRRAVVAVSLACLAVALATLPFALPYAELRGLGFGPRPVADVERFSADVYAYLTADPKLHVWGSIARGFERPEGALFPGLVVTLLAVTAVARTFQAGVGSPERAARQLSIVALPTALLVAVMLGWTVRLPFLKVTSVSRLLMVVSAVAVVVLAKSRDARARFAAWLPSPVAIFTMITIFALVMSFGPDIHSRGRQIAEGNLYALFYHHVPGFDGLRVPARFGMIVALGLATLAAFAIHRTRTAVIAGALILVESFAMPIPINQNDVTYTQRHLRPLPDRVSADDSADLYRFVAQLPSSTVLVELPLGEPAFDVRYMLYATRHWKPLVNGYSGGAPEDYGTLGQFLEDAAARPDRAWDALIATHATHVIVHEGFYEADRGRGVSDWLRARGATEVAAFGSDRVLVLK
jgi:hypothetical protein